MNGFARAAGARLQVAVADNLALPGNAFAIAARPPLISRVGSRRQRRAVELHLSDWSAGVDRMAIDVPV